MREFNGRESVRIGTQYLWTSAFLIVKSSHAFSGCQNRRRRNRSCCGSPAVVRIAEDCFDLRLDKRLREPVGNWRDLSKIPLAGRLTPVELADRERAVALPPLFRADPCGDVAQG